MPNFDSYSSLILTKLQGITELVAAYDYHTEDVTGYPCATFEPSNNGNQEYTNTENFREYAFDILVYQEMKVAGRRAAIANIRKAVDAVITAFDSDTTLRVSGGAHIVKPVVSDFKEYVGKAGPTKYAIIKLVIGVEIAV